jgi:hypothetical protein
MRIWGYQHLCQINNILVKLERQPYDDGSIVEFDSILLRRNIPAKITFYFEKAGIYG